MLCLDWYIFLKELKQQLKKLDGDGYKQLDDQVLLARKALDVVQHKLHDNPIDVTCQIAAQDALTSYVTLNNKHMSLLQQRAKMHWSKDGDSNSRYFHSVIAQRRKMHSIYVLFSSTGEKLTSHSEIVNHILGYYTELFGTTRPTSPVDRSLVDANCHFRNECSAV